MRGGCLFSLQQVGLVAGLLPRCPPFPSRADVLGPRRASRKLVCRGGGLPADDTDLVHESQS